MQIKGIIFDLDGVLVDTVPLHYAAWKHLFEEYGYRFNEQIYREKVDGRPRLDGVIGVMPELDKQAAIEAGNRKQDYYLQLIASEGLTPFATTIPFVNELKQRGIVLAAASSSVNTHTILEQIGIIDEFKAIVTSDDVEFGKPHPEIFLTAANNLGLSASECVVFEDAQSGVEAAKRGGFFCVAVDRHHQFELFQAADLIVSDLGDVTIETLASEFSKQSS